jgi:hypothetical protein
MGQGLYMRQMRQENNTGNKVEHAGIMYGQGL